ncbi:MAG: hypothetical protein U0264_11485 [Candidatus Kapaibacterium sp.]
MKFILLLAVLLCFLSVEQAVSLPQFSLMTGNKCQSCHINSQGGGLRNDLGWYSWNEQSLISPSSVGLGWLYGENNTCNTFLDDNVLTIGTDLRLQSARGHAVDDAPRKLFPMQTAVYGALRATKWLQIEASINPGHKRFGSSPVSNYSGQQPWTASVIFQPTLTLPQLRAGFFMPSIGMRNDDHTKLIWNVPSANGTSTQSAIIPPLYAEFGAEATYDATKWLTVSAGIFDSKTLSEMPVTQYTAANTSSQISLVSAAKAPSFVARAVVWPRFMDDNLNTYLGSSVLINDDFTFINTFAGVGLSDKASLMLDFATSTKKDIRTTSVGSIEGMYQLLEALLLTARVETGRTTTVNASTAYTQAVVLGAHVFVLPYVEIRPEYRIMDTDDFRSSRYAFQLHLFY